MSNKARRLARRLPWQDELSLSRIDAIIEHFTERRTSYTKLHAKGVRDYTDDIARVTRCASVWTEARAMKLQEQSIAGFIDTLRLNAPEHATTE
jgi:hypothetical protein